MFLLLLLLPAFKARSRKSGLGVMDVGIEEGVAKVIADKNATPPAPT